jgi:hypothetical protein
MANAAVIYMRNAIVMSLRETISALERVQTKEELDLVVGMLKMLPEIMDDDQLRPSALNEATIMLKTARERLARVARPSSTMPASKPPPGTQT